MQLKCSLSPRDGSYPPEIVSFVRNKMKCDIPLLRGDILGGTLLQIKCGYFRSKVQKLDTMEPLLEMCLGYLMRWYDQDISPKAMNWMSFDAPKITSTSPLNK